MEKILPHWCHLLAHSTASNTRPRSNYVAILNFPFRAFFSFPGCPSRLRQSSRLFIAFVCSDLRASGESPRAEGCEARSSSPCSGPSPRRLRGLETWSCSARFLRESTGCRSPPPARQRADKLSSRVLEQMARTVDVMMCACDSILTVDGMSMMHLNYLN